MSRRRSGRKPRSSRAHLCHGRRRVSSRTFTVTDIAEAPTPVSSGRSSRYIHLALWHVPVSFHRPFLGGPPLAHAGRQPTEGDTTMTIDALSLLAAMLPVVAL